MSKAKSADGTEIDFDRQGSGPTVILVAGATQFRGVSPSLQHLAQLLAGNFCVVNYDRRGRGASGDTLPYTVDREIEDLAALIGANGGEPASLVGFSSGAVLALMAGRAGLELRSIVAYEPPFIIDEKRAVPADYAETLRLHHAAGDGDAAYEYFLSTAIGIPAEHIEAMRGSDQWKTFSAVGTTIYYDAEVMGSTMQGRPLRQQDWAGVKIPVLVVNGDESFDSMPAAADALAAVLPKATRVTLPGQGHGPAPEVLAPVVIDFLTHQ